MPRALRGAMFSSKLSEEEQPQLQKAARSTEKASKGDKNPKDFILFPKARFSVDD